MESPNPWGPLTGLEAQSPVPEKGVKATEGATRERQGKSQEVPVKSSQERGQANKGRGKTGGQGLQGMELKAHYRVTQPISRTCSMAETWPGFRVLSQ